MLGKITLEGFRLPNFDLETCPYQILTNGWAKKSSKVNQIKYGGFGYLHYSVNPSASYACYILHVGLISIRCHLGLLRGNCILLTQIENRRKLQGFITSQVHQWENKKIQ
jgi:hypothetical protein